MHIRRCDLRAGRELYLTGGVNARLAAGACGRVTPDASMCATRYCPARRTLGECPNRCPWSAESDYSPFRSAVTLHSLCLLLPLTLAGDLGVHCIRCQIDATRV
jgi:hypothetical protein